MSAATSTTALRIIHQEADLRRPPGLDDVERTMQRLTGGSDHASVMCREVLHSGVRGQVRSR